MNQARGHRSLIIYQAIAPGEIIPPHREGIAWQCLVFGIYCWCFLVLAGRNHLFGDESQSSGPPNSTANSGPFIRAAWPFKPKKEGPLEVNDPFRNYGAESQAALARQLTPANPGVAAVSIPDPSALPRQVTAEANSAIDMARMPVPTKASATGSSPPYPWPAPVDSARQPPGVDLPADVWGSPANPSPTENTVPSAPPNSARPPQPQELAVPSIAQASLVSAAGNQAAPQAVESPRLGSPLPNSNLPCRPDLGTRVLAIVGNQTILANDLLWGIDDKVAKVAREAPPEMVNAELDQMFQKMLPKAIEYKLLYIEFLRMIPPEGIPAMEDQAGKHFAETELPKYYQDLNVSSPAELDAKFREMGTTLVRVRQTFFESEVAKQILPKLMKFDPEVSHDQRIEYYRQHIDEYYEPAQVRWERLSVVFERCPSREAAFQQLAQMGNEVLGGAPFAEVAKRGSHCPKAGGGGLYDWTRFGSLASKPIENALLTIEPGKLSKMIEDEHGVHIVRVLERRQASYRSFESAQEEILDKVREERFQAKMKSTLDRLREETEIWTVYDQIQAQAANTPQQWLGQ